MDKPKRTISAEHMEKMRKARELKRQSKLSQTIKEDNNNDDDDDDEKVLMNIKKEIERLKQEEEPEEEPEQEPEEEEPEPEEEIKPKKGRGCTTERMKEIAAIRSEKARIRNAKKNEIKQVKEDKLNIEYLEALKIRQKLETKKKSLKDIQIEKELYNNSSKDILKDKYINEAKRRVMSDLFSS
jgi:hypothetical protein